jgi:hypothetical protein
MKNATPNDESSVLIDQLDTSAATQRNQILAHLKRTPSINTLEFRELGFISPAPRLLELRQQGHNIKSHREDVRTPDGRLHRGIARYYLSNVPQANYQDKGIAA